MSKENNFVPSLISKLAKPQYRLLSIQEYLNEYSEELAKHKLLEEVTRYANNNEPQYTLYMLEYPDGEHVTGSAYPYNFSRVRITDFRKYGGWSLKTTLETITDRIEKNKASIYSLPKRIYDKIAPTMVGMHKGQNCQFSSMDEKTLELAKSDMTPAERSLWVQAWYKVDVSLTPTIEMPVLIRLDGYDDGAEELLLPDMESAHEVLRQLRVYNSYSTRTSFFRFRSAD